MSYLENDLDKRLYGLGLGKDLASDSRLLIYALKSLDYVKSLDDNGTASEGIPISRLGGL